MTLCD